VSSSISILWVSVGVDGGLQHKALLGHLMYVAQLVAKQGKPGASAKVMCMVFASLFLPHSAQKPRPQFSVNMDERGGEARWGQEGKAGGGECMPTP
jgi:hypothetical protein